ncbi:MULTISPECIES: MarR family winged helix-turn-helix transcriptional regulator [Sporosarcina]|uniref:MarR family winged helix-turn-helix transcriptional regulator n=1 Tax=Sporosarcina TaxID=1569 RepID=UPI00058C37C7|nr:MULTISPECIES: MarR family transcriptional regulator [Sporosarcina]WJY28044.1 MarR family transcriptional regulator [Sporosarcina sp. 0.2-SM1T-5]
MTENMDTKQEEIHRMEKDLRYIAAIIKQQGRKILSNYTITPPQFVALQWLFEHGDMTIGDLSNKMYLAFSTTTDLVDRMEKNELVKRVRDDKDRRVVRIHLLEEGGRVIQEVIDKRRQYLEDVMKDFSEEELRSFTDLLSKLHVEMSPEPK